MIPALIIPAVSRFDMLEANLAAIDHPVARLVIIENSLTGYTYTPPEGSLIQRVDHIRPILGIGVTGGFNAGVMQTPEAPWWLLSSTDIGYGPGDLANIATLITPVRPRTPWCGAVCLHGSVFDEHYPRNWVSFARASTGSRVRGRSHGVSR